MSNSYVILGGMTIDSAKILDRIKNEKKSDRGRVVLYLDKPLLKSFQEVCKGQGVSASRFIEEVMRDAVETAQGKAPAEDSLAQTIQGLAPAERETVEAFLEKAIPKMRGKAVSKSGRKSG